MRIAQIQQTQNNRQQSFKATIQPLENAEVVFSHYGHEFKSTFDDLMEPLIKMLAGRVTISASRQTKRSEVFHIESVLPASKDFVHKHSHVSVPNNLTPIGKALKLASAVFKPFIQAGRVSTRKAAPKAKAA